jgi:hypothetical protein
VTTFGVAFTSAAEIDPSRFGTHIRELTATPHRLAGTAEAKRAGDYIESQLRTLPGQFSSQRFWFPQEIVETCELHTSSAAIPLLPLAANAMQPSVTSSHGLRGKLVYVGKATDAEVEGKDLRGAIAVADFDSSGAVPQVFRRGAKAVIFLGDDSDDRFDAFDKRAFVNADLPRFYLSRAEAERQGLVAAGEGTLVSRVSWHKREGRNLFFWIPGTKPQFKAGKEEFLILSAHYDSPGIVPLHSPSPEAAANCAALLEIARELTAHPPRRSVLIAFFDNHANFLEGGRQFYAAYRRSIADRIEDPLPVRQRFVAEERAYLGQLLASFGRANPFGESHAWKERALQILRAESKHRYDSYQEKLIDLRLEINRLRQSGANTDALQSRLDSLGAEQKAWQLVREAVRDQELPDQSALPAFREMIATVTARIENRLLELDELDLQLADHVALTKRFADANPVAHVSLRFTGGSNRWLFQTRGDLHARLYAGLIDRAATTLGEAGKVACGFVWESKIAANAYVNWATHEESVLATMWEIPSFTSVTEQDRTPLAYCPNATLSAEHRDRIRAQAAGFLPFLDLLANDELASVPNRVVLQRKVRIEEYQWQNNEAVGHLVKSFGFGQTAAERLEPNVLVRVVSDAWRSLQAAPPLGPQYNDTWQQWPEYVTFADGNGCFPITTILDGAAVPESPWRALILEAAKFDADGRIHAITVGTPAGGRGSVSAGWSKAAYYWSKSDAGHYAILNLFAGRGGTILGETMPFGPRWRPAAFRILNGLSNAEYKRLHLRFDPITGVGAYFVEKPMGVKLIYEDPKNEDEVALYINAQKEKATGVGYGPGAAGDSDPNAPIDLRTAFAPDLATLNESRLAALRARNIVLNSVESLHSQAKELLPAATALAGTFERRIYRPVMAVTNDMVVAVTILLLLAIPFAFALQSLVMWTHSIYRRLAWFAAFFAATFAVLYSVHPAFSFATTPIIILLAFVILVMSAGVIWIIGDKFTYEIKKMQGLAVAAHTFDRSLFGNVGAAVSLAISIMRRRPVRTALTVVTVIFLTFTILSFVSFQTEKGVNRYSVGIGDQSSRLLVHRKVWKSMDRHVMNDVRAYLDPGMKLNGRYWRVKELSVKADLEPLSIPIRRQAGGSAIAGAMLSLDALEIQHIPGIRDALPGGIEQFIAGNGVYLPQSLADELGAKPGDLLRIQGLDLAFLGVFDSRKLSALRELDGSPLLPVNFGVSQLALGAFESKGSATQGGDAAQADLEDALARLEPQALEPVSADSLILVPTRLEAPLGMSLKGMVLYPPEGADLAALAERLAVLQDDGVLLNQGGETSFFLYGDKYGVTGVGDVLIPLVLGGLIIFSTMLGSVIDREKEIYTFSALGLAPRNIAMLFFVEAAIYAVIGGFGGYLFSQVVTQALEFLASHGWFRAPEMNYSSSTAINTILVVMATVMVSTIYPAIQAARKATADTARRWRVPSAKGDWLEFHFPFTISQHDITGILCFIREHFASHADRTVGEFAVDDLELFREPQHGMAALRATIWLQPFDQGISQRFELTAHPSDIEEVCEIHVRIERLSGPPSAWARSNRVFLEDIRRQFLLWRTLDDEEREQYLNVAAELEETWNEKAGAVGK